MYLDGFLSKHVWDLLSSPINNHVEILSEAATKTMHSHPDVETRELESAIQEALRSEKAALRSLLREGNITEETFSDLVNEIDSALVENHKDMIDSLHFRNLKNIRNLLTIVIQERDVESFTSALKPFGFPITHIASTGGFLGRKNATLLVGVPTNKRSEILELINTMSQDLISWEIDDTTGTKASTPIGATIFTLDIERYEEI
jgi:uncharacterized protein YaaQ